MVELANALKMKFVVETSSERFLQNFSSDEAKDNDKNNERTAPELLPRDMNSD